MSLVVKNDVSRERAGDERMTTDPYKMKRFVLHKKPDGTLALVMADFFRKDRPKCLRSAAVRRDKDKDNQLGPSRGGRHTRVWNQLYK